MAIITQKQFSTWVEIYKSQHPELSYLKSVESACDYFVIEYDMVKPLITPQLYKHLEAEAIARNILKIKKVNHSLERFFS